jgi:hypothetical protein
MSLLKVTEAREIFSKLLISNNKLEIESLLSKLPFVSKYYQKKFGAYKKTIKLLQPTTVDIKDKTVESLETFLEGFIELHEDSSVTAKTKNSYIAKYMGKFNKDELYLLSHIMDNTPIGISINDSKKFKDIDFFSFNYSMKKELVDIDTRYSPAHNDKLYPLYIQEKMDGMKVYISYNAKTNDTVVYSKRWHVVYIPDQFIKFLNSYAKQFLKEYPSGFILEGELYGDDRAKTNGLMHKLVRTEEENKNVYLTLWDIYPYDIYTVFDTKINIGNITIDKKSNITYDKTYDWRFKNLNSIFNKIEKDADYIKNKDYKRITIIPTELVDNYESVEQSFLKMTTSGKEGLVLKSANAPLVLGSSTVYKPIKMKLKFDCTLKLDSVQRGNKESNINYVASMKFVTSDEKISFVVANLKHDERIDWNENDYEKTFKEANDKYAISKISFLAIALTNGIMSGMHCSLTDLVITPDDKPDDSDKVLKLYKQLTGKDLKKQLELSEVETHKPKKETSKKTKKVFSVDGLSGEFE